VSASASDLYAAVEGTWPPARSFRQGPWTLREGQGGGKRVSAATAEGPVDGADIAAAETAMRAMGQVPLFMIREGDEALDSALEARGYAVIDPVTMYACAAARLTDIPIPRVTILRVWEPLAIMLEMWAAGGIGPDRIAVMHRAKGPKTGLLGRFNDKPAGCAFAAIHDGIAMVHAVEILPHQRKLGVGKWMMRAAAFWAASQGARTLAVVCTDANTGANALYASLGMQVVGQYHYRIAED
jgi:GNAT superfamily N-acetyltransferase